MRTTTFRPGTIAALVALATIAPACGDDDDDGDAGDVPLTIVADDPGDATTIDVDDTSAAGTSSAATTGATGTVVVTEPSVPVTARVGQSIAVPLDSNPSTGYSWLVVDPGDPAIVAFVGNSFESSDPDAIGAGGTETLVFSAVGEGVTVVVLAYDLGGDVPTTDPAERVELTVTVVA